MLGLFRKDNIDNKKRIFLFLLFFVLFFLFIPKSINAGAIEWMGNVAEATLFSLVAWILYLPIYFFGFLVTSILIPLMIWIASYNGFLTQEGVNIGWQTVRDLANMFIIVGILIIAFGTLFRVENYSYKKLLPKLVIAAILINFSKFIMGFLIDISQVIMLTFVHAFDDIAGGNLIYGIGLTKILSLSANTSGVAGIIASGAGLELLVSLILGVIVLVVTAAVLLVITAYLVARVIMLWLAIVLSPLLFAITLIPSGQKFASQIWNMVSKYLITGPLLAFFLWLSFTIISNVQGDSRAILESPAVITKS
jgi:hypothetical protein